MAKIRRLLAFLLVLTMIFTLGEGLAMAADENGTVGDGTGADSGGVVDTETGDEPSEEVPPATDVPAATETPAPTEPPVTVPPETTEEPAATDAPAATEPPICASAASSP